MIPVSFNRPLNNSFQARAIDTLHIDLQCTSDARAFWVRIDLRDELLQFHAVEDVEIDFADLHRPAQALTGARFHLRLECGRLDVGVEPQGPRGYS